MGDALSHSQPGFDSISGRRRFVITQNLAVITKFGFFGRSGAIRPNSLWNA